ncbi:MAG: extracellular solute-binding protein [Lachnospiraceae bacterium]|nr:extracellular solute-binding protein [Lachnospiraceae bacterium]
MHFKQRIIPVLALIIMMATVIAGSKIDMTGAEEGLAGLSVFQKKETIYFWYEDASMTDFLNSAAVSFGSERNVRVIPVLVDDSEYLEAINRASLHSQRVPDVYLLGHESLEKAYLAGLASPIMDEKGICIEAHFPQTALSAVTYHDKLVAYPLSFETSALVYNKTYLQQWAEQQEQVVDYMIPETVDDILKIGDTFDVPEGVEGIMKWDVSDIFYNYWIVGNYMIVGGDPGDDEGNININNEEAKQCLEVYKALNQFFYIESDTVTFDSVVQDFIEGKIVFTIATTDVIGKLEAAGAEGRLDFEYGIAGVPAVSSGLASRSLSVTTAVCINGYSSHQELANEFATYLVNDYSSHMYQRTGRMSAKLASDEEDEGVRTFKEEYAKSVPLTKMMATGNFWIELEVLFSKVWNGGDIPVLVQELSDLIMLQIQAVTG